MKNKLLVLIISISLAFVGCEKPKKEIVVEVTTFKTKSTTNNQKFNQLDSEVENNFTAKQKGFIRRESLTNGTGEYAVIVYWETLPDAEASMKKFMGDASVASYASMIDGSTMKMNRYVTTDEFKANNNTFVEIMSYKTKSGTDVAKFNQTNKSVETTFTAKQKGFLQRVIAKNDQEDQLVLVYWDTKENSDKVVQSFMKAPIAKEFMGMMDQSSIQMYRLQALKSLKNKNMELSKKDKVVALLNTFNTGDKAPIAYINPEKYIQHNLMAADGLQGFGEIMAHKPPQGFKANVVRAFEDGNYVFTHTEYDFFGPKAGFDIFRFEDGKIVEHWDNLLDVQKPNPSGRTQFDGATEITDLNKTEANKNTVKEFIDKVLLGHEMDKFTTYINPEKYIQHNPAVADGLEGFGAAMKYFAENGLVMEYTKLHKVLGQGNFVLTVSEGKFGKGDHTSFYDLFRLENGKIVEHWDVIEKILPKSEWKNNNGKF